MESTHQPQPNLASILQTLRAYAPSQHQPPLQPTPHPQPPPDLEEGEYDPSTYDPSLPLITTPHPQAPAPPPPQLHQPPPATAPPPPTKPPSTPPNTITTWPPALRHITTLTASTPTFTHRIRHLITTQHTHERQWWTGRLELQKRLAGREEGRKKLDSVLGSLGGRVDASCKDELPAEQELGMYDRKVYKACKEMVAATAKELKRLEVPFFCVVEGLVGEKGDGKEQGKRKGMISEQELVELRGRMMVLLEDLCGEE